MNLPQHIYLIENDEDRNEVFGDLFNDEPLFRGQLKKFIDANPEAAVYLNGLNFGELPAPQCLLDGNIDGEKLNTIIASLSKFTNDTALLFLDFGLTSRDLNVVKDQPYLVTLLQNYKPSNARMWAVASSHVDATSAIEVGYSENLVNKLGCFRTPKNFDFLFFALAEWRKRNDDLYSRFLNEVRAGHDFSENRAKGWIQTNTPEFIKTDAVLDGLSLQLHNLAAGRAVSLDVGWFLLHLVHQTVLPSISNPFNYDMMNIWLKTSAGQGPWMFPAQDVDPDRMCALQIFREAFGRLFVVADNQNNKSTVISASLLPRSMSMKLNFNAGSMSEKMQHFARNALKSSISSLCSIKVVKDGSLQVSSPGDAHETSGFLVALRQSMHVLAFKQMNVSDNVCGADVDLVVKCDKKATTVEFK